MKKKAPITEQAKREVVVQAAVARKDHETIADIARRFGTKEGTLKGWLKASKKEAQSTASSEHKPVASYTPSEQLEVLLETAAMSDSERAAWCRARGLFAHQLAQFKQQLSAPSGLQAQALREAKRREEKLEREIQRKDKALAEAAALLVLQKKFQSLFAAEGE
jgi:transposase-like protein